MGTLFFEFLKFNSVCSLIVCIDGFLLDLDDKLSFYHTIIHLMLEKKLCVLVEKNSYVFVNTYMYIKQGKH